jgi:hypothetical protein
MFQLFCCLCASLLFFVSVNAVDTYPNLGKPFFAIYNQCCVYSKGLCLNWTSNSQANMGEGEYFFLGKSEDKNGNFKPLIIVRTSCRKHFWKVSWMSCFPWWSDKVMIVGCWVPRMWCYFSIINRPFSCTRHRWQICKSESQVFVSTSDWPAKKKKTEILDCCHSQQCKTLMVLSGQIGR